MQSPLSISVSSTINSEGILQKAALLAKKLNIPFVTEIDACFSGLLLTYGPEGLRLLLQPPGTKTAQRLLFVDFVHGKNGYRLAHDRSSRQPLGRAVGIKPGFRPRVLDGTGGLGNDAFVLASLGCRVTMCERSPIMAALLEDGLLRATLNEKTAELLRGKLCLVNGDSLEHLQHTEEEYDTVYLDPMYPHRRDSALNKQSMRIIRTLVGDDQDSETLLVAAVHRAANRVVVKRPRTAPPLAGSTPSHAIIMKNSRFDIYLTFNAEREGHL